MFFSWSFWLWLLSVSVDKTIKTAKKYLNAQDRGCHIKTNHLDIVIIIYCIHMYKTKLISTIPIFFICFHKNARKRFLISLYLNRQQVLSSDLVMSSRLATTAAQPCCWRCWSWTNFSHASTSSLSTSWICCNGRQSISKFIIKRKMFYNLY